MPTYKLTYFNNLSRGETARMLFKLAEQPYEDVRVNRETFLNMKPGRLKDRKTIVKNGRVG